jgi:D-aminoacyl-tRNA deacylase
MRIVCQRVLEAKVTIDSRKVGGIGKGLLVYLGVSSTDNEADAKYVADKLVNLRIFANEAGKMNKSILDVGGEILLVSNFTLMGDCRKGRRPGFDVAAKPELANSLYEKTAELIVGHGINVEKGIFGGYMHVDSINDGPITILLDSFGLF